MDKALAAIELIVFRFVAILLAACLCQGREPGVRPGGRGTFLCFAKEKYPKERRPPVCDPCASLRGKPASGRLRGAPWNSLCCCAAPLGQPRRVRSRSTRAPTRVLTPQPPRRRRSQQGVDSRTSKHPLGPSLRSARQQLRPARGACAREVGPSAATARVDVCSPSPLYAPRSAAASGSGLAIV